jgi:KDO2-lipid IV(A) lauroyltransferase
MAKPGRLLEVLEYAAARSLLSFLGALPRAAAIAVGFGFARLWYTLNFSLRRTGERNLQLAFPEMSEREHSRILSGCFMNLGRLLGEFSHFERKCPESLRQMVVCEGLEHLERARNQGHGVVLFTGHLGVWDLTSFALSALGYPLDVVVRRIDNPKVDQLIEKTRTRFGNRAIDKRFAARPLLKTLLAGGTVGILIDQNMLDNEGIFVDFFGTSASTTFLPAKLALRTGAAVIPVFAPWDEQHRRFVLKVDPPLNIQRTGDEKEDIRRMTSLMTSVIETYVRSYPDQWLWIHKRWRTRPAGQPDIY